MKTLWHVTDLDQLLWYNKLESMDKEALVSRLLHKDPPNEKMMLGTAFHSLLENPPADAIETAESEGYLFKIDCEATLLLPQVKEIRANKTYLVEGVEVTLSGKCDGISSPTVKDYKLTFRPNPETYFESYQWRAYLDIFGADIFEYIICSAKQKDKLVTITDISVLRMFRYPNMVADLESGIRNLLGFVKEHIPEMIH